MLQEKKPTKRQLQAQKTRETIFHEAQRLFRENGIEKVGISDIVKAANVSTGTFYLYFSSKEQIISEIYLGEDSFFVSLRNQLKGVTCKEKIISYFTSANEHMEKNGCEIVCQLYYPSNPLIDKGSSLDVKSFLVNLIKEGQQKKEISTDLNPEDLAEYFFSLNSGIIFEWCLQKGAFPLKKRTKQFLELTLKAL